jgi:hypothetical protein
MPIILAALGASLLFCLKAGSPALWTLWLVGVPVLLVLGFLLRDHL